MINIGIRCIEQTIGIEGNPPVSIPSLQSPFVILNLITQILDTAHLTGETICLEFWDGAGVYHEVNRWGSIR